MNDFFTELDSDLLGVERIVKNAKILPVTVQPRTPVTTVQPRTPAVADVQKTPVPLPVTIPQTPRVVREMREPREENISNFSLTNSPVSIFPTMKQPQSLPSLPKGQTRVMAIGWCNEVGKNMSLFQYGDEIILIDGGIRSPEDRAYGVKYSLPDISFLFPHKRKIAAMVITSAHPEHIAWLKHLLPSLGYPKVYATRLTIAMIKREMEDSETAQKTDYRIVNPDSDGIMQISAHIKMELFRQNHNIPDSVGVYIETPNAKIVYTGDFKFDPIPSAENPTNFVKLRQISARGIDLLMSDSTHAMKDGFTKTEAEIGEELHEVIHKTEGRIIIAIDPSLIGRIGQIIKSAQKTGRSVFLNGKDIAENVNTARELGLIAYAPNSVKRITNKIDSLPDGTQIILTTVGWEGDSGLYRMAMGEHPVVKIRPGDTVIFSSALSPLERGNANLMNMLIRLGATLFAKDGLDIHSSGHPSKEEQKIMINLVRPRNFMPIQGEFFMRVAHKTTAVTQGISDKNVFLVDNGSFLEIDEKGTVTKSKSKMPMEEIIVDGRGIGLATSHVIEARMQMMKSWVVTIVFKADEKTKTLLGHLKIETRGLVYLDEVREAHKMIIKKARASYEDTVKDVPDIEEKDLIKIIRRDLEIFLLQKMERNPVIIPMILYV